MVPPGMEMVHMGSAHSPCVEGEVAASWEVGVRC